jgi:transketolase
MADKKSISKLQHLSQKVRYDMLQATTAAGSGHPTSGMSACDIMTALFFGGFLKQDITKPKQLHNDRVLFSKGHASPLLYALYETAGGITYDDLMTLRKMGSDIEGHPTPRFMFADVASGSLGQGLSVGAGMALGLQKRFSSSLPNTYVLLGDSEFAEGQIWEALEMASYYNLSNLVGILDVNRLGQRGETVLGWDIETYERRIASFDWNTVLLEDGHDMESIVTAWEGVLELTKKSKKPTMIIAKTTKGKGVSFLEDADGWHGKAVPEEKLKNALHELGEVDPLTSGTIALPPSLQQTSHDSRPVSTESVPFDTSAKMATREAYGHALEMLAPNKDLVALDAETSNSTFAEVLAKKHPEQFFEMFIAEQNMVSMALGMAKVGFTPYTSTFAAFFTRAFDQIRMAQYSEGNVKIVGSHAGVSIGQDGSSQMGLEDIAMMRSILESVVLYPSDAISAYKLALALSEHQGIGYLRLTREKTPVLYETHEQFVIGGSRIVKQDDSDTAVIITAGITLHEALKAYHTLKEKGISVAVLDAYSIKPLDTKTIQSLARKTSHVIVVEDHYPAGGLGEGVMNCLRNEDGIHIDHLAVSKIPRSGSPQELLAFAEIDAKAIISAIEKKK